MGDILRFTNKKIKQAEPTPTVFSVTQNLVNQLVNQIEPSMSDGIQIGDIKIELGSLDFEVTVLLPITRHLNALVGHVSQESVQIRRDGLKDFTLLELEEIAQESTADKWTSRPAYYQALIDEIRARKQPAK